ncbi:MAG: hypothetical protein GTO24_15350 [candidate division Zixibacteria bacterium]|nr:hypothetical protein [candidate division Zixibacteria bacterium]
MPQYQLHFWVPLINFYSERQPIRLRGNLSISVASDYEKQLLSELKSKWSNIRFSDFLLRLTLEKDEPESKPHVYLPDARAEIEKAITIFRLFRAQPVGFNAIIQRYNEDVSYAYSAIQLLHYMLWAPPDSTLSREIYELQENEVKEFASFFREYDLPTMSNLGLAIGYFNKSYIEPYTPRDSVLDIMICLENLFLRGTHQELSYKLAMRMAHLLGGNVDERSSIFQFVNEAYSLRSKIVHGGDIRNLSEEYLFRIRDLARKSIRYLLKHISLWSGTELDKLVLHNILCPNH